MNGVQFKTRVKIPETWGKRKMRPSNANESQLSLGGIPLTQIEIEMDNAAFEIGRKLANIAIKVYNSKSKILNYKDLIVFRSAWETISKI